MEFVVCIPSYLNSVGLEVRAFFFLPTGIEINFTLGHFAVPSPKNQHAKKGIAKLTEVTAHLGFPA